MAKKVLTPEQQEIKSMKKAKRSQNWTKFWAVVLALVLTVGIAFAGKSQGEKNVPESNAVSGQGGSNAGSGSGSFDNQGSSSSDDTNTPDVPDAPTSPKDNKPAADDAAKSEAEVAELINKVTGEAVAQKVGYDWKRDCAVKDIDVGRITNFLNTIIQGIDKNADLNSVVGGFLGNGNKKETVKKGETLDTKVVTKDDGSTQNYYHGANYTLKATNLKAEDIKNLKVTGNKYSFDLPDSLNPDRNGNTALSRFTNDIVIREEVEAEIKGFTNAVSVPSLTANYKNIKASVTIKDGKLVEITYSYYGDAQLDVKVAIATVTGTGNLTTTAVYSNFKY